MTGIFAPFGVGILGIVALAAIMGVGSGVLSGGFFCALVFKKRTKETMEMSTRNPQSVVESRVNHESYKKLLTQLTTRSFNCTEYSTRDASEPQRSDIYGVSNDVAARLPVLEKNSVVNPGIDAQQGGEKDQFKCSSSNLILH